MSTTTSIAPIGDVRRRDHVLTRLRDELADTEIDVWTADLEVADGAPPGGGRSGRPLALVRPWTVAGVSATLRVATATGTAVVVAPAGVRPAAQDPVPDGAIVLSTERLNRILGVDPTDQTAVVQAGVLTSDLNAVAAAHDLAHSLDPSSAHPSRIGDAIAGGIRGNQGAPLGAVLGLTVVAGDGRVLTVGRRLLGHGPTLDMTGLFVGSEGALGVIVEAVVRLRPRPARTRTLAAWFPSSAAAAGGVLATLAQGITPSVIELGDANTLRAIDESQGTELAAFGTALLVVRTEGPGADAEIAALTGVLVNLGADVELPEGDEAQQYLDLLREGRSGGGRRWLADEEVAVPRAAIGPLLERIERIGASQGVGTSVVAHSADDFAHSSFTLPRREGETGPPPVLVRVVQEAARAAADVGGRTTGTYGVGRPGSTEPGPALELAGRLKSVFDPAGVLRPHTRLAKEASWPAF